MAAGSSSGSSGNRVLIITGLLLAAVLALAFWITRHLYGLGDPDATERARLKRLTEQQAEQALSPQVMPGPAPAQPLEGARAGSAP